MGAEHVVMEAESTALLVLGQVVAALMGGLEDSTQQHSRVLEFLRHGGLDVEVVAVAGSQSVVLPGPGIEGGSGALGAGPVEHISSTLFLCPATQPVFEVTLQLWSCETQQEIDLRYEVF